LFEIDRLINKFVFFDGLPHARLMNFANIYSHRSLWNIKRANNAN